MAKPAAELARAWLLKSYSDLDTARQIGGLPGGDLDAGICHCQQAAEKSLKGFLILLNRPAMFGDRPEAQVSWQPPATAYPARPARPHAGARVPDEASTTTRFIAHVPLR
jgi:hypothetical protein